MAKSNAVPLTGLVLSVLAFSYIVVNGRPLLIDAPTGPYAQAESAFATVAVIFVFATIFISMRRAYRAGSKLWFFLSLFAWPASFVYTLLINRSDES